MTKIFELKEQLSNNKKALKLVRASHKNQATAFLAKTLEERIKNIEEQIEKELEFNATKGE